MPTITDEEYLVSMIEGFFGEGFISFKGGSRLGFTNFGIEVNSTVAEI